MRATMVWLLAVAGGAACGGGDDPGLPLESYCTEWTGAVCATATRCACISAELEPACLMAVGPRCPLVPGLRLRMDVEAGVIPYDPVAAARQVEHIRTSTCSEDPLDCDTTDLCFARSAEGGPCGVTSGCAAGLACIGGTCVAPAGSALGAPCVDDEECASGNCDFATERCREPEPIGGLCVEGADCASGYCNRPRELAAGACEDRRPTGGSCTEPAMCVDGGCVSGICTVAVCAAAAM